MRASGTPDGSDRWAARPVLGAALRVAVLIVPLVLSVLASLAMIELLPTADGVGQAIAWWVAVLGTSLLVLLATDRLARRMLPLAVLLELSLIFPDRAPSRLRSARTPSTRELERNLLRLREAGESGAQMEAAETLVTLVGILGLHDKRTRGHSERVRAFTDLLAVELGLDPDDGARLRWAALVHDIGKLTVPSAVLNSPHGLAEDEWATVRRHPAEGERLAAGLLPWLGEWGSTVVQHHERWDGDGYPQGLAGTDISYGARIVAVADSFEVMTSARSYNKARSAAAARAELTRCAGKQFDPDVVRAFLNVSFGRLLWVLGPVSWLAQLPLIAAADRAGQAVKVVTGGAIVGALIVGGAAPGPGGDGSGSNGPPAVAAGPGTGSGPGAAPVESPSRAALSPVATATTAGPVGVAAAPVTQPPAPAGSVQGGGEPSAPAPASSAPTAATTSPTARPTATTGPTGSPRPTASPTASLTASPTASPGPNVTPTGSASPSGTPSPSASPTGPVPASDYFLSPDGFVTSPPTAAGPPPDVDGDGRPGRTLQTTDAGLAAPPGPTRYDLDLPVDTALVISGPVSVELFLQLVKDARPNGQGNTRLSLQVALLDCTTSTSCVTLATGSVEDNLADLGFVRRDVPLGQVDAVIAAGHVLRLSLVLTERSAGSVDVGLGVADTPSRLVLPAVDPSAPPGPATLPAGAAFVLVPVAGLTLLRVGRNRLRR